jgi:hypothetical protein
MKAHRILVKSLLTAAAVWLFVACGAVSPERAQGVRDGGASNLRSIGGTVSGLAGETVVLANDASDTVRVASDGPFVFPVRLTTGARYSVTVLVEPSGRSCEVASGSGTVGATDVNDVRVTCTPPDAGPPLYTIGGHVTGLEGASVTLLNGTDSVVVAGDGSFTFPVALPTGAPYAVTPYASPAGHSCTAVSNVGYVAEADVTSVVVTCPSTVSSLSALTSSAGALSPAFSAGTLVYTAGALLPLVPSAASMATVTATTTDPGATITINGSPATSGVAGPAFPIPPGPTQATIVVTAADGVTTSTYSLTIDATPQQAYLKPANTTEGLYFGQALSLSGDGNTLAVAASGLYANGIPPSPGTGVHIFMRSGGIWSEEAFLVASNPEVQAMFGYSVALSEDGNALAVGAPWEASDATGVDGDQNDMSAPNSGAVYLFTRAGSEWTQIAYIKASKVGNIAFGIAVGLSGDGSTLAVCAPGIATIELFSVVGDAVTQENAVTPISCSAIALSDDGMTLAAGVPEDSSDATGIDGNPSDTSMEGAGAVYTFVNDGTEWSQQAYIKASNPARLATFGASVSLSSDGNVLGVGAYGDSSDATGVNGNQLDMSAVKSGAAYVFQRTGTTWAQTAYVKASNTAALDVFGLSVSLTSDGGMLAVGALSDQDDVEAGAAYVFENSGGTWNQVAYMKPSNPMPGEEFGYSVALSSDGLTLACGAPGDTSGSTGVNGSEASAGEVFAGSVFVFE